MLRFSFFSFLKHLKNKILKTMPVHRYIASSLLQLVDEYD